MDNNMNFSRGSFNHSSAQYVIVDVGIPTPSFITENVLTAVQNVVCLGRNQVPAMGVALVNSVFQQVVSLSSTRTQLHKILRSLKSVMDTGKCRARISMQEFQDNVHIGINRALEDFQSLPARFFQEKNEPCPSELQITIFSMKNGTEIQNQVEQVLKLIAPVKLKKIQVVELIEEYMESKLCMNFVNTRGFVELCRVPGSAAGLDQLFKQWLVSAASYQEYVRVVLPNCQVLCDIRECIAHPTYPTDSSSVAEVLRLEVTHRMSSNGLCMTQLWGDPVTLLPTRSYQLDCAGQQINHQYFTALTEKVMMADEYLVAKCETKGRPLSYFILMPGEGLLVMKRLVTAEMALPFADSLNNCVTPQVNDHINDALVCLPSLQSYRPVEFPSGLYKHLAQSVLHPDKPQEEKHVCGDPSHEKIVVGIEIKKTTKQKKLSRGRVKKNPLNDIPQLTSSEQKTLTELFARKKVIPTSTVLSHTKRR